MKYHNKKVYGFDSKKEKRRFDELKILQRIGEIRDLKTQVPFELIPAQKDKDGKTIERAVKYIADFTYADKNGMFVVEDVKSPATRTKDYIIKRKLMLFVYKIRITEI
ncbi:MAG: DUF1064 domain-containing protein [Neisseriaceae bacterium]|nr:DUF1064 domain-containing protein [Neisseriaceae bacterium]